MMQLKKGDIIDVITPASPISRDEFDKISQFLAKKGLKMRFFMEKELVLDEKPAHLFAVASAEIRFKQLKMALESDSKAIWCARGGYGSADLIPFLALEKKIAQSKNFIGFSDITSLSIFLQQQWNFEIIASPMLAQLAFDKVSLQSKKAILDLIFDGKMPEFRCFSHFDKKEYILQINNFVDTKNNQEIISGILVGGCLSVIMQSLATLNQINWNDKILFLEDIDERGEKLDRFFMQILQISKYQNSYPKAILLGNFIENISDFQKQQDVKKAIENFAKNINEIAPKIKLFEENSKCLGHSQNMMPLIIGGNFSFIKS